MTDELWQGDMVLLVEAFRSGERHPREELSATLAAAAESSLNAVCHIDAEAAMVAAEQADVSPPMGGVPIAIKELLNVDGWPDTEASLALADRVAAMDSTVVVRLRAGRWVVSDRYR